MDGEKTETQPRDKLVVGKGKGKDDDKGKDREAGTNSSTKTKRVLLEGLGTVSTPFPTPSTAPLTPKPPKPIPAPSSSSPPQTGYDLPSTSNTKPDGGMGGVDGAAGYVKWVVKKEMSNFESSGQGKGIEREGIEEGEFVGMYYPAPGETGAVVVQMSDGSWLKVARIKVEGSTWKPAGSVLGSVKIA